MTDEHEELFFDIGGEVYLNWHKPKWSIFITKDVCFTTADDVSWLHRWMTTKLLGWRWEAVQNDQKTD